MRGQEFLDKMELVDAAFLEEAEAPIRRRPLPRILTVAACLCLVIAACLWIGSERKSPGETDIVNPTDEGENQQQEHLAAMARGLDLHFHSMVYCHSHMQISADLLGEKLGRGTCEGYDWEKERRVSFDVPVYAIKGVDSRLRVAVPLENGFYYVYCWSDYVLPATLGELMDDFDLENTLPLFSFSIDTEFHGYLYEDEGLWEILRGCETAPLVFKPNIAWYEEERVDFTIVSEVLGIYPDTFSVYGSGYLVTYAFISSWSDVALFCSSYEIGREAAQQIIQYVREHGEELEDVSPCQGISGIVIAITEDEIHIDNSLSCEVGEDVEVFRFSMDNIRVRRHVEHEGLRVGWPVWVEYEGEISEGNYIAGVVRIHRCYDVPEGPLILE